MVLSNFLTSYILPFVLVFVVVFAILQKSKIFGDKKSQIDSLVSLVIGLMAVSFPGPREMIGELMPWLALALSVMLVFFILYGFVHGDLSTFPNWMKIIFGVLAGIFTVGVVLYVTGLWSKISSSFRGILDSNFFVNAVIIIVIIALMALAVFGKKGSS